LPNSRDRKELQVEEQNELSLAGPFGGIQSELPLTMIEDYGFDSTQNIAFRFGEAYNRPTFASLPSLGIGEIGLNFATFWDSLGYRQQILFTNARILAWNGLAWNALTGPTIFPLVAPTPFTWSVLNYKLCFANGGPFNTVPVYLYDPQAAPGVYTLSSAAAQAPLNMAEVGLHLMTSDVNVSGTGLKPQRYQWSGVGDPTDWTSFSSGINDLVNDLGPAYCLSKLGQYGFGYHPNGLVQIVPTGTGSAPFAFYQLAGANIGPTAIFSKQKMVVAGLDTDIFVGPDNVYMFNQTSVIPIGNAPIGQRRYVGARRFIMQDVAQSGPVYFTRAHVTHSPSASPYLCYYLLCIKSTTNPALCPLWVYNFDEENWTRWIFNAVPNCLGDFSELVNTFVPDQGDKIGIAFNNGGGSAGTLGYIDFNQGGSEVSYSITSGKCIYKDRRHKKSTKRFRLAWTDLGTITWTLTVTNEVGVSQQQSITLGTGSGDDLSFVFNFNIPSLRLQWTLTAPAGSQFGVVEVAPIFDVAGEQRCGTVDGN
jgi:hypothetical protein